MPMTSTRFFPLFSSSKEYILEREIYLDNSATTRMSEEALAVFSSVAQEHFGNPSSLHSRGRDAESLLTSARAEIRRTLGDSASGTVIFTSGGTEANNLAIFGRARAKERYRSKKILTTAGEHASVSRPLAALANEGMKVVEIPTRQGRLDSDALARECTPDVVLASMMLVNNESGALYDLAAVSRLLRARCPDAVLHCDVTQAYLKVPFTANSIGASLLTISSHKIEGPKGMGALWVDSTLVRSKGVVAQILGGGQENGFRSGTENVPGIAAFAAAARNGYEALREHNGLLLSLRKHLLVRLAADPALSSVSVNLPPVCAPHIISLTLPDIKSETMLHALSARGIYVSSGSACSSHGRHGTAALEAFGLAARAVDSTIRVSLSYRNTVSELDGFCLALGDELSKLARMK